MSKKALVISRDVLNIPDGQYGLFSTAETASEQTSLRMICSTPYTAKTILMDRSICETDNNFLQLLPYVVIKRVVNGVNEYASYQRGKGGTEDRLHAKYSIGFGGHVDSAVPRNTSLVTHLANECLREVMEEIGLEIDVKEIEARIWAAQFICINTTPVDDVHLGVVVFLDALETTELKSKEVDQICELKWRTKEELQVLLDLNMMENWTKLLFLEKIDVTN